MFFFYISYNKEHRLKSEKCIKLIMAVAHSQYCQTSQDDDNKDFRISLHFLDWPVAFQLHLLAHVYSLYQDITSAAIGTEHAVPISAWSVICQIRMSIVHKNLNTTSIWKTTMSTNTNITVLQKKNKKNFKYLETSYNNISVVFAFSPIP